MPLIPCPECGRQISTEATACPQCGHPNRPAAAPVSPPPAAPGPQCYACPATATTRCVACGALSCAEHLNSVFVQHGQGGAYELRCQSCYDSAMAWKTVGYFFVAVIAVVVLCVFVGIAAR